ncbi:MAG: right-handed parallel beta-helix repeat-containing protein [Bryobacteraceae bacterium]
MMASLGFLTLMAVLLTGGRLGAGAAEPVLDARNPQAVQEVLSGKRRVASAAWWGFDEEDSTDALQAAILSRARRVIVPNMRRDWIVRPIKLASDLELVLEDGVVITARRGEFRGTGDSLFTAQDVNNLTIRGYGATLRMQKEDYMVGKVLLEFGWNRWFGQYPRSEWRMALSLRGCTNVRVLGLTLKDSGGDGIFVAGGRQPYSKNIYIRDVVCDNHYRQGISVISVEDLTVENSVFRNTWGTPPSSGVDIEPDRPEERVRNVVFRNCRFEDNYGDGIEIFLANLKAGSGEVSILFDNCRVSSQRGTGIRVTKLADDGPRGWVEFRNCTVENTEGYGIKVQDKSSAAARLRFLNCVLRNVAKNRMYRGTSGGSTGAWSPIWLHLFRKSVTTRFGGIDFVDCVVEDTRDRPVVFFEQTEGDSGLFDVTGNIAVWNPAGVRAELGGKQQGVTLTLKAMEP